MKQLNLVPVAVRQKAHARRSAPMLVIAGIIGATAAGAAWFGFNWQLTQLRESKAVLVAKQTAQQEELATSLASLKIDAGLTERVNQLNTLAKSDVDWNKAFVYVAAVIPKEIVLGSYAMSASQGVVTLKIVGEAPSNASVATFAEFLKKSKGTLVTDYKIDGYTYIPTTGRVTFSMTITVPRANTSFETKS